jgi:peptidyl-dipeptidase Dcp
MFFTASKLYGLAFKETTGTFPRYHPLVRTFEVMDAKTNELVGIFIADFFARSSKRSGAWMSAYREQHRLDGTDVKPIIVNVLNFNAPSGNEPVLLSASDSTTLFHEMGHALHGLLSNVTYPSQSGTSVLGDFVELPSQINEHWVDALAALPSDKTPMRHVQTGEPIPQSILDKMKRGKQFGEGFATVEYLTSALVDLEVHRVGFEAFVNGRDPIAIEEEVLKRLDVSSATPPRHRLSHFLHLFSDGFGMYACGYYSYLFAEVGLVGVTFCALLAYFVPSQVLEADAFGAFEEAAAGKSPEALFDGSVGERFRREILSVGGSVDAAEAFRRFRGRDPVVEPLLKKRGLLEEPRVTASL